MDSIFSWLFHGIINLSAEDIHRNLSQHMSGLPKMSQMGGGLFLNMIYSRVTLKLRKKN